MPGLSDDLAPFRRALQLRDACTAAAVANGQRLDLPLSATQARVAYDAMEGIIASAVAEEIAAAIEQNVRHEDPDQQDRGGFITFTSAMAYVGGHDKAAEIARSFTRKEG